MCLLPASRVEVHLTALPHHHLPQLPSRPPSTHTPWSGRGSGRPGGARHCTNDLDALGRVCSALPGSAVDGMGAPRARHYRPAVGDGAPSIPVPADPPPEASSVTAGRSVRCSPRAGAAPGAEPGSAPGGAERSRGLMSQTASPQCRNETAKHEVMSTDEWLRMHLRRAPERDEEWVRCALVLQERA